MRKALLFILLLLSVTTHAQEIAMRDSVNYRQRME